MIKRFWIYTAMSIVFIFAGTAIGAVDDSLLMYLTFDEGQGDAVKDLSSYENNGKTIGNPLWVEGIFGSALEFNGVSDSVEVEHDNSLNIESSITLEMWVRLSSAGPNDSQVGIEKGGWETGEYSLYACYIPGEGTAMQFMNLPEDCGDANSGNLGPKLQDDQWHHIAGTWDGKKIALYTDGNLEIAWECEGGPLGTNKKSVFIGSREAGVRFLKGAVDEVRIYNRVLSEDEIKVDMKTLGKISVSPLAKTANLWGEVKGSY